MSDVKIKGRIVYEDPQGMFIRFMPKSPVPVASVCLPRQAIAVVQEPGDFVTVEMPLALAEDKGIDEYII